MRIPILALCLLSSMAAADRRQGPTFQATTTYEHCQITWAHACGMRDSNGMRYGTAHAQRVCERYTFRPDGTFSQRDSFGRTRTSEGTYRIFAGRVLITPDDDKAFELALSPDGTQLGLLKRLT
jgi:hypothetical protein